METNNELEQLPQSGKVAIFGGSFDPVHLGHLTMAETVKARLGIDHILFVPCFVSPFKDSTIASGEDRVAMVRLAVEELRFDWASVSTREVLRPEPSYSWETASYFSEVRPDVEWHWIVGTDQWQQLEKWAEPETLARLLTFLVLTRGEGSIMPRAGWDHKTLAFDHPASSTAIRADFARNREWLTPSVQEYCVSRGLYGAL